MRGIERRAFGRRRAGIRARRCVARGRDVSSFPSETTLFEKSFDDYISRSEPPFGALIVFPGAYSKRRTVRSSSHTSNASSARSMARASAAALFTVSWYSLSGFESATIPAPDCTWMVHSRRARFEFASLDSL